MCGFLVRILERLCTKGKKVSAPCETNLTRKRTLPARLHLCLCVRQGLNGEKRQAAHLTKHEGTKKYQKRTVRGEMASRGYESNMKCVSLPYHSSRAPRRRTCRAHE